MKRFVAAAVLLLALGLGAYWAIYYQGLYLPSSQKDAPEIWFRAEGKSLQRWDGQEYSNVILRRRGCILQSAGALFHSL